MHWRQWVASSVTWDDYEGFRNCPVRIRWKNWCPIFEESIQAVTWQSSSHSELVCRSLVLLESDGEKFDWKKHMSIRRGLGNPLQYSSLENPMDRGAWWATVRKFTASDTTEATGCTHTVILAVLGFALIMFMFKLILLKRELCFVCLFNFFVIWFYYVYRSIDL